MVLRIHSNRLCARSNIRTLSNETGEFMVHLLGEVGDEMVVIDRSSFLLPVLGGGEME